MDRQTKTDLLFRYVADLEDVHGSVTNAEEKGDKLFKEMREFVKQFFDDHSDEPATIWGNGSHWSKGEIEAYLKEHYATKDTDEIADELGMSPDQVRSKAWYMGLKKPKNDKAVIRAFIIENHKTMSRNEMAEALGITYAGICYYLKRLKAEGKVSNPFSPRDVGQAKWTKEEEDYLAKSYPSTSINEMAKALGRTDNSVRSKAHSMGLKKK